MLIRPKSSRMVTIFMLCLALWSRGEEDIKKPNCVQPDYKKWAAIREGMTEAEVREVLGEPLHATTPHEDYMTNPVHRKWLTYGRLEFDTRVFPKPLKFTIMFKLGKVESKEDPFDDELSKDGKPTIPFPISPNDKTAFDHYPRHVDLRWRPSSGDYPMEYVIETETGQWAQSGDITYRSSSTIRSDCPYCAYVHGGKNPGRWRVKAKNSKGESEWSEWRYFIFKR